MKNSIVVEDPILEPLLDQNQVARILNTSPKMLEGRRYRGGGIPWIAIGKLVRYRLSDVKTFLDANRRTLTPHVPRLPQKKPKQDQT